MKFGILRETFRTNQSHLPSHHLRNKLEYSNRSKLGDLSLTNQMAHCLTARSNNSSRNSLISHYWPVGVIVLVRAPDVVLCNRELDWY